jgi:pyridoxal 5'-phosphate synthase pdxT subunit
MKIGVLALQGAFIEHIHLLQSINIEAVPVRLPAELKALDALIIPGGESTTMSKLLIAYHLLEPIKKLVARNFPILGTCAGMVLLAKTAQSNHVQTVAAMDIIIKRNAYGRQVDSFEADLDIPVLGGEPFRGIFIRAPIVDKAESGVRVLCTLNNHPVALQQKKMIVCSFHPELTGDVRLHKYFIDLARGDGIAERNDR